MWAVAQRKMAFIESAAAGGFRRRVFFFAEYWLRIPAVVRDLSLHPIIRDWR